MVLKKCLVVCWFGNLPNYFQLFLDSCSHNKTWNWLIITDALFYQYDIPQNVKFEKKTFNELSSVIQKKLYFKISLDVAYKLCDYKPAYGYLFTDLLKGYDYWGYCDIDVIWGDLSKFYPDDTICRYKRFLYLGHLSLYKNIDEVNKLFAKKINHWIDYRIVFSSEINFGFDEIGKFSIKTISEKSGMEVFCDESNIADIYSFGNNFEVCEYTPNSYLLERKIIDYIKVTKNAVYTVIDDVETERAYTHLQKRKLFFSDSFEKNKEYYIRYNLITNERKGIKQVKPEYLVYQQNRIQIYINRLKRFKDILKYGVHYNAIRSGCGNFKL